MGELSIQDIQDYNNRNAFTRVRTASLRSSNTFLDSLADSSSRRSVKTQSLSDSYTLLSGLSSRLEMIRSNLTTMYEYARLGSTAQGSDRDEYIGLLRSLSGGIDDVVDATVWKGENTLDGRVLDLSLSQSGSGASKKIDLGTYYSSDEDGFNLTSQPASGKVGIFYDYYASYRNQQAGVVGLDITEGLASDVDATKNELDTGTYRLEISYAGPDSSISIKTLTGGLVNKVDGVDLSGTGQELVDLEVGVTLSISKEQILQSIDKYDYENEGPATLYAVMDYERVYRHELSQENFSQFTERELDVGYKRKLTDGSGGSVEIESLVMSGISPDKTGFASGSYSLRVNYRGENSSVEIRDSKGSLLYLDHKVDLSGNDKVEIDTGKGISFTIDNDSFSGETGQMIAFFDYQAEGNNNEDFDFNAYMGKIEEAVARLDSDWDAILDAQDEILLLNSYTNGTYAADASTTAAGMVTSLLAGSMSSDASSIFSYSSANSGLSLVAGEIFQNTSAAMSVQANIHAVRAAKVLS